MPAWHQCWNCYNLISHSSITLHRLILWRKQEGESSTFKIRSEKNREVERMTVPTEHRNLSVTVIRADMRDKEPLQVRTSLLRVKEPGESLCSLPFGFCPLQKTHKHSNPSNSSLQRSGIKKNIKKSWSTSGWRQGTHLVEELCGPPRCVVGCCWAPLPLGSGSAPGSQMEGCYCLQRQARSRCHYTAGWETPPPPLNSPSPHWAPPASGWTWGNHKHWSLSFLNISQLS